MHRTVRRSGVAVWMPTSSISGSTRAVVVLRLRLLRLRNVEELGFTPKKFHKRKHKHTAGKKSYKHKQRPQLRRPCEGAINGGTLPLSSTTSFEPLAAGFLLRFFRSSTWLSTTGVWGKHVFDMVWGVWGEEVLLSLGILAKLVKGKNEGCKKAKNTKRLGTPVGKQTR